MSRVKTIKATGADGKVNTLDVILRKAKSGSIVFFPGDISTGRDEMKADEEANEWLEWSTEAITQLLARRFQLLNIILVRPVRMRQGHSCYDHFLTTNLNGDPRDGEYDSEGSASLHLLMLLEDLTLQMGVQKSDLLSSLHLVGFSKGAVVLNQLLAEFGSDTLLEAAPPFRLLSITRTIEWLDAGISDGSCVFLTDEDLLRMAASRFRSSHPMPGLYVVLSPFQLALDSYEFDYPSDEEAATSEELGLDLLQSVMQEENIPLEVEYCCFNREPTMHTHFRVLKEFNIQHILRNVSEGEGGGQSQNKKAFKESRSIRHTITMTLSRTCVSM